ncbi:MAG: hypothetical protein ABIE94_00840 [archaeon]
MAKIQTGVDKLVELVNDRKRIALDKAAKELGVSTVVVQEWADFLEEEGIISIEYSLSKVYLVEKKLTKKEVQKKAKEYSTKKDVFVRKVESSLRALDRDTAYFDNVKKEFETVKSTIGSEINAVKGELEELRHYEQLKNDIDKNISKQKQEFQKTLDDAYDQIREEEKKYSEIITALDKEKDKLTKEKDGFKKLMVDEDSIKEKLGALKEIIREIDKRVLNEKTVVDNSEQRIKQLSQLAQTIEKNIRDKKEKTIAPLVKLSEEHKDKIMRVQNDILEKIKSKQKEMANYEIKGEEIYKKFQGFFDKKAQVDDLFKKIDEDRNKLKKELGELIKKAIAFNLSTKSTEVKKQVTELEKKLDDIDDNKDVLKKEIGKLSQLIKA